MKYAPSLPPPTTGVADKWALNGVAGTRPVKPVQERTLPPLVSHPHPDEQKISSDLADKAERRHEMPFQERRIFCRRVAYQPILEELRSAVERRRNRQRSEDLADHIDEKV